VQEIGKNSYLKVKNNFLIVEVRRSVLAPSLGLAFALVFIAGFCFLPEADRSKINDNDFHLYLLVVFCIGFTSFFSLTFRKKCEMDMGKQIVIRRKYAMGILFYKSKIHLEKNCVFRYEIEYDTYNDLKGVWLTAYQKDRKKKQRLLMFYDMETFKAFRSEFRRKYPLIPIREWHD
jgi:hypothetical protein